MLPQSEADLQPQLLEELERRMRNELGARVTGFDWYNDSEGMTTIVIDIDEPHLRQYVTDITREQLKFLGANPYAVSLLIVPVQNNQLGEYLFSVERDFSDELDEGRIAIELREQFQRQGMYLTLQAQVQVERAGSHWTIIDAGIHKYRIQRENQTLNVYGEGLFGLTYRGSVNSFFVHYYADERRRSHPFTVPIYYRKMLEAARLLKQDIQGRRIWKLLFPSHYEKLADQQNINTFTSNNLALKFRKFLLQNYEFLQQVARNNGQNLELLPRSIGVVPPPEVLGEDGQKVERLQEDRYHTIRKNPLALLVPVGLLDESRIDANYYLPRFINAVERVQKSKIPTQAVDNLRVARRQITDGIRKHTKTDSGVLMIRTQNLAGPTLNLDDRVYVDQEQHQAAQKSAVREGDLLVAIRGYLGKAAIVDPETPTANINQHIARVSTDPKKVDTHYLWAFFSAKTGATLLEREVTGTVQQGITLPAFRDYRVPLPARPIQGYIGDKVRLAEHCRVEAQHELRLGNNTLVRELDLPALQFKNSKLAWWVGLQKREIDWLTPNSHRPEFLQAEENLRELGNAIPLGKLINKGTDISNGATPRGANYEPSGIPFLRVQNVERNFINLSDVVYIPADVHEGELKRSQVKAFDLIVTITGYPGNAAVATPDILPLNMNQHSVRVGLQKQVDPFFVAAFLNSDYGIAQVRQWATGATRDALTYGSVKSILIPVISVDDQQRIGLHFRRFGEYKKKSAELVSHAKSDVEAMIDGTLDTQAILDGHLRPPTWEDVQRDVEAALHA